VDESADVTDIGTHPCSPLVEADAQFLAIAWSIHGNDPS
jgi:hypothetical protein